MRDFEPLNEAGRSRLAAIRKNIERLNDWVQCGVDDDNLFQELSNQRKSYEHLQQTFRKANMQTMLDIEKKNRQELLEMKADQNLIYAPRPTNGSYSNYNRLWKQENDITQKMLAISKNLSETTQKSALTLDTLILSSQNVHSTKDELQTTSETISYSGQLIRKYGRRECTDKILLSFAFAFFLASVAYIIQKRLF